MASEILDIPLGSSLPKISKEKKGGEKRKKRKIARRTKGDRNPLHRTL